MHYQGLKYDTFIVKHPVYSFLHLGTYVVTWIYVNINQNCEL